MVVVVLISLVSTLLPESVIEGGAVRRYEICARQDSFRRKNCSPNQFDRRRRRDLDAEKSRRCARPHL